MIALVDVGGTKTRIALGDEQGLRGEPVVFPTPRSYPEGARRLSETIRALAAGGRLEKIVIGIAGVHERGTGKLLASPHLPEWARKNIRGDLSAALGAPVIMENDSALEALGEAVYGAGKGVRIVAYVSVGTGVGGGRVVAGAIDRSAMGFEPGHQYLEHGERSKSLEELVSGTAMRAWYGRPPAEIFDKEAWEECARTLAYGVHNVIVHWSPDVVILGGSMMTTRHPGIDLARVDFHLRAIMRIFPTLPELRPAALGEKAGLLGALSYANSVQ